MRSRSSILLLLLMSMAPLLSLGAQAQEAGSSVRPGTLERVTVHGDSLLGNLAGDSPDRLVSVYLPPG
jgi:hypothetical protein